MFRKSKSSHLLKNKKNVEKLLLCRSPKSSATCIDNTKRKVTNKMLTKSQKCRNQNQGLNQRKMRIRTEANTIISNSPCPCRTRFIDPNSFKYYSNKPNNKKITTIYKNEKKCKVLVKNNNRNKRLTTADAIKRRADKPQVNCNIYEGTVNFGLRTDNPRKANARQSHNISKYQQAIIDPDVSKQTYSLGSKSDISSTCVHQYNYEESKVFMDRVNYIKKKLKTMTNLEQIKLNERNCLKSSTCCCTTSQTGELEAIKDYNDSVLVKSAGVRKTEVDTKVRNTENGRKRRKENTCVKKLQINLETPYSNENEVMSCHSYTNIKLLDTNMQKVVQPQMQLENINSIKTNVETEKHKKFNNQCKNVTFHAMEQIEYLNEMGDNKISNPTSHLLSLQKETIKRIQNSLRGREKQKKDDFKSSYNTKETKTSKLSSIIKFYHQFSEDDNETDVKFEDECYRLLKEIQKIQQGSVNLLNQLNKGLIEQGKIYSISSQENVPISLCGTHKKPDIDSATLQNVFGAPGQQMFFGQVTPVVPDQGTLSDPDYWDTQDIFRPSSLNYDMFDWNLTKRVAAFSSDNFLLSPLGLKLALAILTEAATGSTQAELVSVLGFEKDRYAIRNKFASIIGSLQTKSTQYILNLGSRLYVDGMINPRQRLAAVGKEFYKTEIKSIDFKSPSTALRINSWVYNVTEGKIPALVTQDDLDQVVVMILNTLYFQGTWRHQFAPNATKLGTFYITPTNQTKTLFMNAQNTFYCANSVMLDAKILRLPYMGDKFSMYIIVPNSLTGLPRVLDNLSDLQHELLLLSERVVDVSLPKFEFDYTSHLDGVMKEMGVRQIFEDTASFPGISRGQTLNERLKVSKILQKAGIELNELGSTAYSATEISLVNKFGVDNDAVMEVNANKPFLFFIEDETTRQLLFTGRYADPLLGKMEFKHL